MYRWCKLTGNPCSVFLFTPLPHLSALCTHPLTRISPPRETRTHTKPLLHVCNIFAIDIYPRRPMAIPTYMKVPRYTGKSAPGPTDRTIKQVGQMWPCSHPVPSRSQPSGIRIQRSLLHAPCFRPMIACAILSSHAALLHPFVPCLRVSVPCACRCSLPMPMPRTPVPAHAW